MPTIEQPELIIREIIRETTDTCTFILEGADGWKPAYKAGQFLTFIFPKTNGEDRRSYSLSSCPDLDEPLSVTVKRVDNGAYSRYFNDHARIGDRLRIADAASGLFVLPEDTTRYKQVFFLAAGSGITPVFSLIKSILHSHPHLHIVLIYSNRSAADTIFYDQLISLAQHSQGRLLVDFLFSSSNNILKSRLNNSLLTAMLAEYGKAKPSEILCYTCGPVDYMDTVGITLLTEGIPKDNIRKEYFVPNTPEELPEPPDKEPHTVRIRLKDHEVSFSVQYPVSILQQARKEGIALPYSCESGQCGSCAARCTEGHVWIAYNEVLTDRELSQGLVLTCQGFPVDGDIRLEYE